MKRIIHISLRLLLLPLLTWVLWYLSSHAASALPANQPALDIGLPPPEDCDSLGDLGEPYVPGVNCRSIIFDGYTREYVVIVPPGLPENPAAVFMFHGSSGTGPEQVSRSGWAEKAAAEKFVAVFPTGLQYCNEVEPDVCKWATKWNAYTLPEEEKFDFSEKPVGYPAGSAWPADDVGFTGTMIDNLLDPNVGLNVDPDRVYASGFSNGAGMVGRLAVELADRFAAVGYVSSGLVKVKDPANSPEEPVAHIPVFGAFGTDEEGIQQDIGWDPVEQGPLPLNHNELLSICNLMDLYLHPHLEALELDYNRDTFWPLRVSEMQHSTLLQWYSPHVGGSDHLFQFAVLEGLEHHYPNGVHDKNPLGFRATDIFWPFFQDPLGQLLPQSSSRSVAGSSRSVAGECDPGATTGDYGDAADGSNLPGVNPNTAYVDTAVSGAFPTTWPDTLPGPVHFNPQIWLGDEVSLEAAADVGADPDGANNIVDGAMDNADNDGFDDGWLNQDALFLHCRRTSLKVRFSRGADPNPPDQMYLNVWFDGNRDGDWNDYYNCPNVANHAIAGEWIVRNRGVNVAGIPISGFVDIDIPTYRIPNQAEAKSHWIRFTLGEQQVPVIGQVMPDGRGPQAGYDDGESEDYLYQPPTIGLPGTLILTQTITNAVGTRDNVSTAMVMPGDNVSFEIELAHVGGSGPAIVELIDTLPEGLRMTDDVSGPFGKIAPKTITQEEPGGIISWQGTIAPDSKLSFQFQAQVGPCYTGGTRQVTNIVEAELRGDKITAEGDLEFGCYPTDITDIEVQQKLFAGDFDFDLALTDPGELLSILAGSYGDDNPLTLVTTIANIGPNAIWLVLEQEFVNLRGAVEKIERGLLAPGESRSFSRKIVIDEHVDMLAGLLESTPGNAGKAPADALEPVIESYTTVCLLEFWRGTCPDPGTNPQLVFEGVPVKVILTRRDLGDAPDSSNHLAAGMTAYPAVAADFPTIRDPATGLPPGPVHIAPGLFHLGKRVSLEVEADVGLDQDPSNNILPTIDIANRDWADDGIRPGLLAFNDCQPLSFQAQIFISQPAVTYFDKLDADGKAFLNAWLDYNGDGDWDDARDCPPEAPEHIIIDREVDPVALGPGLHIVNLTAPAVPWEGNDCAWFRIMLSDRPAEKPLTFNNVSYGDGRGATDPYIGGESEDFLICPGGGSPEFDVQVNGRVALDNTFDAPSGETYRMETVQHYEFLLSFADIGGWTAEEVNVNFTLDGKGTDMKTEEMYLIRGGSIESLPLALPVQIDNLEPGVTGKLLVRASSVISGPVPPIAAQFTVDVMAGNELISSESASMELERGTPLFAPTITDHYFNLSRAAGDSLFIRGSAIPHATVMVTLICADGAHIDEVVLVNAEGIWTASFSNVPLEACRVYAVTKSDSSTSPSSNELILPKRTDPATPVLYAIDSRNAGQALFIDLAKFGVMHLGNGQYERQYLVPGETYDVVFFNPVFDEDVGVIGIRIDSPAHGPASFLTKSEKYPGVYQGQFTVPLELGSGSAARSMMYSLYLAMDIGPVEKVWGTQIIVDGGDAHVYDAGSGQTLEGAVISALEARRGVLGSRLLTMYQNWTGVIDIPPFTEGIISTRTSIDRSGALDSSSTVDRSSTINTFSAIARSSAITTTTDGSYLFLPPDGDYRLAVTRPGYQPYLSPEINVTGGLLGIPIGLTKENSGPVAATVTIDEDGFSPGIVTIRAGETIAFVNTGLDEHTVAGSDPTPWSSGILEGGRRFTRDFVAKGVYTLVDETNPAASLTVIVKDAVINLPLVRG